MEKINQLIEIVYDHKRRKLRARNIQDGRWCSFPNNLRIENKIFKAGKITKGRGDSWRASKPSEFDLTNKNTEIENILELSNKSILKEFYNVIISKNHEVPKINTEMLNIIFILKQIRPDIDEQLLRPLLKRYSHNAFIKEDLLVDVQNMLMGYNSKRIVTLFSNYEEDDFLEDTVIMYKTLFENDLEIDNILPKKPKKIRELHEIFSRECSKIKRPKRDLNQNLDFDGIDINEEFKIIIPKTTHDLIDVGNILSICVGNGYYGKKVLNKESSIIVLFNKIEKRVSYCVEYDKNDIIQARGFANSNMNANLRNLLLNIIYKEKDLKKAV